MFRLFAWSCNAEKNLSTVFFIFHHHRVQQLTNSSLLRWISCSADFPFSVEPMCALQSVSSWSTDKAAAAMMSCFTHVKWKKENRLTWVPSPRQKSYYTVLFAKRLSRYEGIFDWLLQPERDFIDPKGRVAAPVTSNSSNFEEPTPPPVQQSSLTGLWAVASFFFLRNLRVKYDHVSYGIL